MKRICYSRMTIIKLFVKKHGTLFKGVFLQEKIISNIFIQAESVSKRPIEAVTTLLVYTWFTCAIHSQIFLPPLKKSLLVCISQISNQF